MSCPCCTDKKREVFKRGLCYHHYYEYLETMEKIATRKVINERTTLGTNQSQRP